jgi:Fe-S-cluster-containing dehydrogenase component
MPPLSGGSGPVGARQWRSLAELEGDAVFLDRAAQEFPILRDALSQPRKRRHVLRLIAASLAMGGLAGCYSGEPGGVLIPEVRYPPEIVPGLPNHYCTAHVLGGYALGTVVTHQMGRPIKVEGNPNHPSSLGATDAYAQAEVLGFYDPDRAMDITHAGTPASLQTLLAALVSVQAVVAATRGAGLRVLTGNTSSPTVGRLMHRVLAAYPEARWHVWEPVNRDRAARGAMLAYGRPVEMVARLENADVILGLDSDLLGAAPGWVRYAREFASRRNPTRTKAMSRVYAAEASPTLLGSTADHRFVTGPQELHAAVVALGHSLLQGAPANAPGAPSWLAPVVADLRAHHGRAFIHAGPELSPEAHALVFAMNEALGGRGVTYDLIDPVLELPEVDRAESIASLAQDMHAGRVSTLLMIDTNPVFTAPGGLDFAHAMERVPLSIALGKWPDETGRLATWSVPMAHDWETWSDARGHDGTATIRQPMAMPLYGGLGATEVVSRLLGEEPGTPREVVQATWRDKLGGGNEFDAAWHQTLADGVVPNSASAKADVTLRDSVAGLSPPTPPPGLHILFRPDPRLWDGRFANNPWLQEMPDPLTKLTWDNPLLISPDLARRTGLRNGNKVNLRTSAGAISLPVWIQPGQAPDTVLALLGGGRRVAGGVGADIGWDVYPLTGGDGLASLEPTSDKAELASTDHHNVLFFQPGSELDKIVKHATLDVFHENPTFAKEPAKPEIYHRHPPGPTAWAMSVDLNACIGCNACVIACMAENNVPTVGKEQVLMQREMHWLRIDRYYEGTSDEPEAFFQPMLCMHCEKAPCELVCPPGATVHDAEGLNLMVYNRCIGTRFCSNNCPYKVRRFNFYPYSYDMNRPAVSWNNNVSMRSGGVMEKCTYCVQRIWSARVIADQANISDGDIEVRTACQAACPTQVFTFGDQNNAGGDVHARKQSPLDYALLEDQNTHPRTTYEALVRNPNPAIGKENA